MEGICAIISFDHRTDDLKLRIDKMARRMSDGESLNHTRLQGPNWAMSCSGWIESHWQPFVFHYQEQGLHLVAIGDFLNMADLARMHRLPEDEVGAILAACYRTGAVQWPLALRGNFAIIVFDDRSQKFVAVTDRMGIRPLCWHQQGSTYYLSSRIDAIRQVCPDLIVDPMAIYRYMHYEMIPSTETIYSEVQKLAPGFIMTADRSQGQIQKYWDITATPKLALPKDHLALAVYDRLEAAVGLMRKNMASNAEIGCFLSGGTDSSSICGLLSKTTEQSIKAYSIGFPENGYDEMFYARAAADAFRLNHSIYYMKPEDVLNSLPKIAQAYDEPFGNSSVIPTFFCARQANLNGGHYLLAGDGGDEIFGGNERYSTQQIFRNYFRLPRFVRSGLLEPLLLNRLERLPIDLFHKASSYIRRARLPEVTRIYSYRYVSDQDMFSDALLALGQSKQIYSISEAHFDQLPVAKSLDRHLYMDMKLTLTDNDLRKVTRMCELAHVRVRYPMLDHPIIELGFSIPVHLKLKGSTGLRYIFKEAFRDLLPEVILTKKKHGFGLPISQWLRNDPAIKKFAQDLLFDPQHLNRGYFRPEFVRNLWQAQLNDTTPYYGSVVWLMMMLELWHQNFNR